jgi:glycine cleavage system transcriptional repressor
VLVEHDANIEDSSMSILRGRFAMVLVVALPDAADPALLETELRTTTAELDLLVHVERAGGSADVLEGDPWSLSVYGADRPGIVHRVASCVAEAGVNVTDLTTRVVGDASRPVYVMLLSLTVPTSVDLDRLRQQLAAAGSELGIECSLQPADPDIL